MAVPLFYVQKENISTGLTKKETINMASKAAARVRPPLLLRLHPVKRLIISVILAATGFIFITYFESRMVSWVLMWCIFSAVYLALAWVIIFNRTIDEIKRIAKVQDGSNIFVYVLILASSFASLLTVLTMISSKHSVKHDGYVVAFSAAALLLSWMLVHTMYTFHYAHLFYDENKDAPGEPAGGLQFPGKTAPEYIDFAYFAFVIGMTFQVSDVQIISPLIRRTVLLHGLISFVLNTFLVALSINLIAGLNN